MGVAVDGIWVGDEDGDDVGFMLGDWVGVAVGLGVCWHWNTGHVRSGVMRHASPKRNIT